MVVMESDSSAAAESIALSIHVSTTPYFVIFPIRCQSFVGTNDGRNSAIRTPSSDRDVFGEGR
jgi:hypothetical protein